MNEEVINLSDVLGTLRKKWKLIILLTISFAIFSAVFSFFIIKPKYESKTKLFVGKQENQNQDYNSNDIMMYQKLLSTYAEVIKTDDLISKSLKTSFIDRDSKEVLSKLVVTPRADTQILEISYQDTDPKISEKVVSSVTDEFINYSKTLIKNGNVQIIQKAQVPDNPISPNKILNIIIATILGFIVGVGLAILLEFMDNTFKTKEEVEKFTNLPVLGVIPELSESDIKRKKQKGKGRRG
ncbi:MAG: YveK family protein [Clostridium sp.]